jgi:subtilisin family serine protease
MPASTPPLSSRLFLPIIRTVFELAGRPAPVGGAAMEGEIELALLNQYPTIRAMPGSLRRKLISAVSQAPLSDPAAGGELQSLDAMHLGEQERAALEAYAPGNSVRGFIVQSEEDEQDDAVRRDVQETLGAGWIAERFDGLARHYFISHPDAIFSVREAWEASHRLEQAAAIAAAEPCIHHYPASSELGGTPPEAAMEGMSILSRRRAPRLDCSTANWHFTTLNVQAAWDYSAGASGSRPQKGQGIRIGHLDTGLTHHQETPLDDPRIAIADGANLYDPQHPVVGRRPLDPMDSGIDDALRLRFPDQDGHGTQTASIITGHRQVRGIAPNATVVPFRISASVVNFDSDRIARGIHAAHRAGCDVITISMGGPPSRTQLLDRMVAKAVEDGVIVCSAAGNYIGASKLASAVVWPAALDEVIAVAGSNCRNQLWSGSSRGTEVNITAPGQEVFRARAKPGAIDSVQAPHGETGFGSGTSYATPAVAGIAACWLAHHGGRVALTRHYGHARYVPMAFARILATARHTVPPQWDTRHAGAGIIDAHAILSAPLPSKDSLHQWPPKERSLFGRLIGGIFRVWPLISAARANGDAAVQSSDAEALEGRFSGEIAYLLFDRPGLWSALAPLLAADGAEDTGVLSESHSDTVETAGRAIDALLTLASPSLSNALDRS